MNTADWPIVGVSFVSAADFVRSWDRLYTGYDETVYRHNIGPPLTPARTEALFAWKNAKPLSAKKRRSIQPYLSGEERIGLDASAGELGAFLKRPGGAVWRIFWLHLQHPPALPDLRPARSPGDGVQPEVGRTGNPARRVCEGARLS